jgi:hypothetical protein
VIGRLLIGCMLASIIVSPVNAGQVFLVIGASARDPQMIAEMARTFRTWASSSLSITTADCGDVPNQFALAIGVTPSRREAEVELARARLHVKDAYLKACNLRPNSLLAFRVDAVDPSIAEVPRDAVNWSDADRISSILSVIPHGVIVGIRHFVRVENDPLEGKRERVLLAMANGMRVVLEDNCYDAGRPTLSHGLIAFDCVREQAGDHVLHTTIAVTEDGGRSKEIEHCRTPKWITPEVLTCQREEVTATGKLVLHPEEVSLEK